MSITYAQHPQFEVNILVDLYADHSTAMPLAITNVERRLWGEECIAKIDGHVTVDVPIDACSTGVVDSDEHLLEVVREAQRRNITSVKTHCVFSVMLDGRAYKAVELDNQINMGRYFNVEMVGYAMNDEFVASQQLVLENELHSYAT